MGKQVYIPKPIVDSLSKCTGIECKDSEAIKKAINIAIEKVNEPKTESKPNELEGKKIKGKLKPIKPMAHQAHEHETLDKEALKKEIIAEIKGDKPETKPDPHQEIIKNLNLGSNFGECKGCDTKLQNPQITKKYKACPSCGNNSVHPERKICPTCGDIPEEWEDGIELED